MKRRDVLVGAAAAAAAPLMGGGRAAAAATFSETVVQPSALAMRVADMFRGYMVEDQADGTVAVLSQWEERRERGHWAGPGEYEEGKILGYDRDLEAIVSPTGYKEGMANGSMTVMDPFTGQVGDVVDLDGFTEHMGIQFKRLDNPDWVNNELMTQMDGEYSYTGKKAKRPEWFQEVTADWWLGSPDLMGWMQHGETEFWLMSPDKKHMVGIGTEHNGEYGSNVVYWTLEGEGWA